MPLFSHQNKPSVVVEGKFRDLHHPWCLPSHSPLIGVSALSGNSGLPKNRCCTTSEISWRTQAVLGQTGTSALLAAALQRALLRAICNSSCIQALPGLFHQLRNAQARWYAMLVDSFVRQHCCIVVHNSARMTVVRPLRAFMHKPCNAANILSPHQASQS
jgi:hypothetical protein